MANRSAQRPTTARRCERADGGARTSAIVEHIRAMEWRRENPTTNFLGDDAVNDHCLHRRRPDERVKCARKRAFSRRQPRARCPDLPLEASRCGSANGVGGKLHSLGVRSSQVRSMFCLSAEGLTEIDTFVWTRLFVVEAEVRAGDVDSFVDCRA